MRRVGALAGVTAAPWTSPVSAADPDPDPAPSGGAGITNPVLAMPDMGVSGTIAFTVNRFNAAKSVSFPVMRGSVPEELRARIELPGVPALRHPDRSARTVARSAGWVCLWRVTQTW